MATATKTSNTALSADPTYDKSTRQPEAINTDTKGSAAALHNLKAQANSGANDIPVSPNFDPLYRNSQTSLTTANDARSSYFSAPSSIPHIDVDSPSTATASPTPKDTHPKWLTLNSKYTATSPKTSPSASSFKGINLDILNRGLSEEIGTGSMKFSNRGSMLVDGKRVNERANGAIISAKTMPIIQEPARGAEEAVRARKRAVTAISERPQIRAMSTDEEQLSEKVRSFYSFGTDAAAADADQASVAEKRQQKWKDSMRLDTDSTLSASRRTSATEVSKSPQTPTISREDHELAGGVEDWRNIDNSEVDRYGFIMPKSPVSDTDPNSSGSLKRSPTGAGQGLQRVSTALQLASEAPRRKHTIRRSPSKAHSTKSEKGVKRIPSVQSLRPSSSKSLGPNRNRSLMHNFTNKLPHNKDRRAMDEAGDFLTLPSAVSDTSLARTLTEDSSSTNVAFAPPPTPASRHKEAERDEKWRKMAHLIPRPTNDVKSVGGGQQYFFPPTSKLIERTWKGIPDPWRATAWHAFLSHSVAEHNRRHPKSPCLPDDTLHEIFHAYQEKGSPDDVQIDIDVPRTISSHIMFRRRYRGGQRLLFRVLHAMSLHFSTTGYVQGMASIAATLLAYYSEEDAFVMLVRMWELRGLEKLYMNGFGGLMEGLADFEREWLGDGDVGQKLNGLGITGTAYGTKWYLTLFGYSIPFGCVLRVWDVFMLLGGEDSDHNYTSSSSTIKDNANVNGAINGTHLDSSEKKEEESANFGTTLDVLHATSAALIDGMRDILLDSDFEIAMKVLTSWVPIRDEDLFMRVARAEWKVHHEKRRK